MSPDEKAMLDAAKDGSSALVHYWIARQTDTNCTLDRVRIDDDDDDRMSGSTSLHFACANGSMALAQLLLDNGADANASNGYGRRPMDKAAEGGHLGLVRLLLRNGANPNEGVGPKGSGPLCSAADDQYPQSVAYARLLIEHGADVNKMDGTETAH
jgi:ankyrin repeat protein